ncbi:MAG TPA: YetF domain-containing protein [Steroidobacteraceae bacterium]|nr:YetF domain-containing protein [Steroidobacteraceae bacterium]
MAQMFTFTVSPVELLVRGTIMYLGLVLVMRFILRRDVGSMSMPDVLFIVLVADASQNAMAGEYKSVADGALLVATLVFWNMALDWLSYHFAAFRRFITPPPLPLIVHGRWMRENLKKQWISKEEVESKLCEAGIQDLRCVELAILEPSGELGIIRRDAKPPEQRVKSPLLRR